MLLFSYDGKRDVLKKCIISRETRANGCFLLGILVAEKSTIMNLLMRFYNIKSGNIVIDGVDLEKI